MLSYRLGALALAFALGAAAQADSSGQGSWKEVESWPDFMGGVWGGLGAGGPDFEPGMPQPQFKPEYQKKVEAATKAFNSAGGGVGAGTCQPHGIPTDLGGEFYYTKGMIFLMSDLDYNVTRRIDMERRSHGDPDLTYYGDSIGHWEGDTLVVDTVGFLPQISIAAVPGVGGDSKTHVVERYRLIAPGKLQLVMTVENPEQLEKPWVTTRVLPLHRDWTVHEAYCNQNNREVPVAGEAGLDLGTQK